MIHGEIAQAEESDISQAIRMLNDDSINPTTKMSAIDMKSILHPIEISSIVGVDTMVLLKVFPTEMLQLTLQAKRLSSSKHGKGREQIVRMTTRQNDEQANGMGRVKASSPIGLMRKKREDGT
jgi:hypothetical protein